MAFITAAVSGLSSLLSGGVGTALSAGASILGGISAYQASNYQAKVAEANAEIAAQNAERTQEETSLRAQEQDRLTMGMLGEQEAAQSASGLSLGGRSQVLTRKTAAQLGRQDALNVNQAGRNEAQGFLQEQANQQASAKASRSAATGNLLGGFLGAASSLVGGSTSIRRPNRITARRDPWAGYRGA